MDIFADLLNNIAKGGDNDEGEEEDPEFIPTESPLSSEDEKEDLSGDREERRRQIAEKASSLFKQMRDESLSSLKRQKEVFPSISRLPSAPSSMSAETPAFQQYISRHHVEPADGPSDQNSISASSIMNAPSEAAHPDVHVDKAAVKEALANLKSGSENSLAVQRVRFAGKEYILQVEADGRRKRLPASALMDDETSQLEKRLREGVEDLTTLKKSRIDWDAARSTAEDKHILDQHVKGDSGFLGRARFLKQRPRGGI